jgi:hypothetical protein
VDGGLDSFWGDGRVKKIIVIDARMVLPVPHGIGRYVKNIAVGLSELAQSQELPYEPVFLTDRRFSGYIPSQFVTVPVRSAFLKPSEILELPRILKVLKASLYHSPSLFMISIIFTSVISRKKFIIDSSCDDLPRSQKRSSRFPNLQNRN